VYDITLKRKRKEHALAKLTSVIDTIENDDDIPLAELDTLMRNLGISDANLDAYSTFDRNRYFRTAGLKFGLPIIDHATGGISKGDLAIISGRLGTGKSTVEQWLSYLWWLDHKRILYVSNEMLPSDVFSRIDGMVGRFNPRRIRTDTKESLEPTLRVVSSLAASSKGEIIIPARIISTVAQVATLAKYLCVDVIVIDGIYLMKPPTVNASRWENVAAVSNALKQMALDLHLPVVGSTQIKRVGNKEEYDPEDIAYSDAIGQDADFLLALRPNSAVQQRIEVQLIKNRYGPQAAEMIFVDYETMSIIDESVNGQVQQQGAEDFDDEGGFNV
jgi:replicative DNA helicase